MANTEITGYIPQERLKTGEKGERQLDFGGKLYFPKIFAGMAYTFKHMFKKSVTVQYPEEKIEVGPEFRGRPVLVKEHDQERCVACGLCARVCPPFAISMQGSQTPDPKERYPEIFEIDMLRCIYCGLCEEVCPEEAIVMSDEYDFTFTHRENAVYGKDKLLIDKERLEPRLEFLRNRRNQNFGDVWDHQMGNNRHSVREGRPDDNRQ